MFEKVLVPLDGTAQAAVALPLARAVAHATGAAIVLLRVVEPHLLDPGAPEQAAAEDYLAGVAAELRKADVGVDAVVRRAESPADAIVGEARGTDLIVMATHGRGGLERAVLGSVAQHVVQNTRVPIFLVRPGGQRVNALKALLVPVDGSPGGSLALGLAVPLARASGARIVLLQVVVSVLQAAVADVYGMPLGIDPSWDDEALAAAQQYVTGLAARLQHAGIPAEGRAIMGPLGETPLGHVGRVIAEAADEMPVDAIVMSTRALTGPLRTVLGSTADEVARAAHRPVLLLRQH